MAHTGMHADKMGFAAHGGVSGSGHGAHHHGWLPAIGAEILLLAAFLPWILAEDSAFHGLAVIYAWSIYGLIALGFLWLWVGPDGEQID